MGDRTEEEEERFIQRNARRMRVKPERLAELLEPLGFFVTYANRDKGINHISLLRVCPQSDELFETIEIDSNLYGETPGVDVGVSIIPTCSPVASSREYVSATRFGYEKDDPPLRNDAAARTFEQRLAASVNGILAELFQHEGVPLLEDSKAAREGADRYLRELAPSDDLQETMQRLQSRADQQQVEESQHYVGKELLSRYNLEDFRIISDIAGLCQVLYWEFPEREYRGLGGEVSWRNANADDIEAHRRFQLVASRLAREPGWPIHDPLVPNRNDEEESVPWRDGKPSLVAELFDEFLSASGKRCVCGKSLYYLRHDIIKRSDPPQAKVYVRCNAGHKEQMAIDASALA